VVVVVEVEEELVDVAYASIVDDVLTLVEVVVETAVHIYIADTTSESIIPSLVALA
jgi:hypothetical protein